MKNKGNVYKYSKNKGYESLSRDLLQNHNLTWGARGLLGYLISLPNDSVIRKTGLYDLCPDKKKATERLWDELVIFGYIIQFRKSTRDGVEYVYLFSAEKFSDEDVYIKKEEYKEIGFFFYLNKQQKTKMEKIKKDQQEQFEKWEREQYDLNNIASTLANVPNEQLGEKSAKVPFEQLAENPYVPNEQKAPLSDSQHMFVPNSSKGSSNIFKSITKGLKEEEEEELINITGVAQNEKIKLVGRYLLESGVDMQDMIMITNAMHLENELIDFELIQIQLDWCIRVANVEGIHDLPKYFLNGLRQKVKNKKVQKSNAAQENLQNFETQSAEEMGDIPLFNWLEE